MIFSRLCAGLVGLALGVTAAGMPRPGQHHRPIRGGPVGWNNSQPINPDNIPVTGVTRQYHFTVARATIAPDGVDTPAILINNQFPGPTIEANWGDWIEVTVENQVTDPDEGMTMHWHGIRQIGTPYYDGVPSTVQCPSPPGKSFTYRFQADAYGSSFYHSHYSAQYTAGVFGAIVIHGPQNENVHYDEDLGPVFLSDWYHKSYEDILKGVLSFPPPATPPYSDNNLINGKMPYDCSNVNVTANNLTCHDGAEYEVFNFTPGKTYRLRLMNVGSQGMQFFTIDGMKMTVFAQDFIPVVPYETDVVAIGVGQRTDVLVTATGKATDAVWMRSDISIYCATALQGNAKAIIRYPEADASALPTTTATTYDDSFCGNVPLSQTVPRYPSSPPATPDVTYQLDITFGLNESNIEVWFVNNETFYADYDKPILFMAKAGTATDLPAEWITYNTGSHSSVRFVMYNNIYTSRSQHPMHLHGHNFWVVAEGLGEWDGVANVDNPMRRDTHVLQPGSDNRPGYLVIDFVTDNPGVWPLHCHLAWHVSAGLYVNILEQPDKIEAMDIPDSVRQTCRDWTGYNGHDLFPEIDAGV
ncbi:Cupredoxin [Xylariaceae sp. FL0804]|nr:Cupredoxin [Xylariaceae sp. FL0804]